MDFGKCSQVSTNKIISTSENKRTFVIQNQNTHSIRKVKVDGCLVNDKRKRCDYLFEIHEQFTEVIYLELKGCDVKKAIKQLESTMQICSQRHCKSKKSCYVVASRVPKFTTEIQNLKKKFVVKNKVALNIGTTKVEIKIY